MHKLTDGLMHPISQIALMLGAVVLIGVLIVTAPPPSPAMPIAAPVTGGMVIQAPTPLPTPTLPSTPLPTSTALPTETATPWPTTTPLPTVPLITPPSASWPTPVVLPMPAVPVAPAPWPTVAADPAQMVATATPWLVPAATDAPSGLVGAGCACTGDVLNCGDFRTHNDLDACEGLP